MASRSRGTIDSIRVGLGVTLDTQEAQKGIDSLKKGLDKGVTVTPQIGAVRRNEANDWLKGLDQLVHASNAKKVKIPLEFDKEKALSNYKSTIREVEGQVKPIIVPVHFRREADPTRPEGMEGGPSRGGGGPRGGGGRPPRGSQGGPARGGVSTDAPSESARVQELESQIESLSTTIGELTTVLEGGEPAEPKRQTRAERSAENKRKHAEQRAREEQERKAQGPLGSTRGRVEESSSDVYQTEEPPDKPRRTGSRSRTRAPLQMQESGGVTSEQRETAASQNQQRAQAQQEAEMRERNRHGRERRSRPDRPTWDKEKQQWTTSEGTRVSAPGPVESFDLLQELEGREFGSTTELIEAVKELAAARIESAPSEAQQSDRKRRRRFDKLSPMDRETRLEQERQKGTRILGAASRLEKFTALSGTPGLSDDLKTEIEEGIKGALEELEDIAPGLGEAFTSRSAGEARTALLRTRFDDELKTGRQRTQEQKRAKRRFSEKSRTDMAPDVEDYPAEFALESLIGSMFQAPVLKKRGGVASADPSGRGNAGSVRTYSSPERARAARAREAEVESRYPTEAFDTKRRIRDLRKERYRAGRGRQNIRIYPEDRPAADGENVMLTELGQAEEKELRLADRAIKTYERNQERRGRYGATGGGVAAKGNQPSLPYFTGGRRALPKVRPVGGPFSLNIPQVDRGHGVLEATPELRARYGQPEEPNPGVRTITTPEAQPNPLAPMGPLQILSRRRAGRYVEPNPGVINPRTGQPWGANFAMGGGLQERLLQRQIQQAYDEGNTAEGQRLQKRLEEMKGGWDEPQVQLPMSPFMQRLRAGKLDPKDMSGMAGGGLLARLFGSKQDDLPRLPRYDTPEPKMALRGGQALRAHGEGPMSPWVKDAVFNQLDPKDFTGKAMGGASSLSDLPDIAAKAESITEVGEQGREAIVGLKGGGSFVVPNHQLGAFKKMVGMADGGFVEKPLKVGGVESGRYLAPRKPGPEFRPGGFSPFSQFNYGDDYEGEMSKIHVSAVEEEAQETLELVHDIAKEMGVTFKYVRNIGELGNPKDNPPFGMTPETFGPGGVQQGKFITAYPKPTQGREMAQRIAGALESRGLGKSAAVAPSERRWSDDSPITHRYVPSPYESGDRFGTDGGYGGPGATDFIGTAAAPPPGTPSATPPPASESPFMGGRTGGIATGAHMANPGVPYDKDAPDLGWDWAPSGPVPVESAGTRPVHPRGVGPAGLRVMGASGRSFATRRGVADVQGLESGTSATMSTLSNDIQRVHVVNWPKEGTGLGGAKAPEEVTAERSERAIESRPASGGARSGSPRGIVAGEGELSAAEEAADVLAGGGPATKSEGRFKPRRDTAEGSAAKFAAEKRLVDMRDALDQVGINISESLQKSPVRALSVAMGQIAQTVVGGRAGILERSAQARALGRRAESAYGELTQAETQVARSEAVLQGEFGTTDTAEVRRRLSAMPEGAERDELTGVVEALDISRRRAEVVRPVAEERLKRAQAASENILTPGQQFRSQAVGLGGIVGGTMLFTAAMNFSQQAIQVMGQAAADTADRLSEFGFTMRRVADELAGAIKQSGGLTSVAEASMRAGVGLPTGVDISAVTEQAERLAGARQIQAQRDLVRSQRYLQARQDRQQVAGVGIGFNNGLFGTTIMQQPGVIEMRAGELGALPQPVAGPQAMLGSQTTGRMVIPEQFFPEDVETYRQAVTARAARGNTGLGPRQPQSAFEFPAAETPLDFAYGVGVSPEDLQSMDPSEVRELVMARRTVSPARGSDLERALFQLEQPTSRGGGGMVPTEAMPVELEEGLPNLTGWIDSVDASAEALTDQLDIWNKQLEKAESLYRYQVVDAERAREFGESLAGAGASPLQQNAFMNERIALVGPSGDVATTRGLNREETRVLEAANKPSLEDLLEEMRPAFSAQMEAQRRQFELQEQLIPSSFASQYIGRPLMRDTAGVVGTTGLDPAASRAATQYSTEIGNVRQELEVIRDEGLTDLRNLGVPQSAIDSVVELGDEISGLQADMSDLQLDLEQAQYNEQIRISVRGIGDLLALNGKQSMAIGDQVASATRLGELQRAQITDQRELSRIQLARSQRELNLQLALSRLRSPGETPEERAVRRREAEALARSRQRELDIGKRSTTRGFEIQDIQFARQLTDAVKQLELLQQARDVTINVRGIQRVIEAKQQLLQVKQQYLEVPREAGIALRRATIGLISTIESRLGRASSTQISVIRDYVDEATETWNKLFGGGSRRYGVRVNMHEQGEGGRGGRASGGIFDAIAPTRFMAGEAGSEQVIVLRNPRSGMLGFSGNTGGMQAGRGGGNMTLNMTINASVSNEGDEDRLVRKVVRSLHDEYALLAGA